MVVLIDTNVIIDFLIEREPFICCFLHVTSASHEEVLKAIRNTEFGDFEDCLQDKCARSVGAQYIITRNVEDFIGSNVMAILPEDFLKILK